jgi:hypothetical protein
LLDFVNSVVNYTGKGGALAQVSGRPVDGQVEIGATPGLATRPRLEYPHHRVRWSMSGQQTLDNGEVPDRQHDLGAHGTLVHIAPLAGGTVELPIMQKRLMITGSTLRPRDANEKAQLTAEVERVVWPWIASGAVKPIVDEVFPLAEAAAAHAYLEAGAHVGKVMLAV